MKKILLITLFLTACTTVPVPPIKQPWPELPKELAEKCGELQLIEGNTTTLTKLLETVVINYTKYHNCKINNNNLVDWYQSQKKIYDVLNK